MAARARAPRRTGHAQYTRAERAARSGCPPGRRPEWNCRQAVPLVASCGSAAWPPRWSSAAPASTSTPPATCTGPRSSARRTAASVAPATGSINAMMAARVGPMERIPSRNRNVGIDAPATPAQIRTGKALWRPEGQQCHVQRPGRERQQQEAGRRAAQDHERRLRCRDGREAAPAQEHVDGLHRGREQGQAKAGQLEAGAAARAPQHHHHHPDEREGERHNACPVEPLLPDGDRAHRDERRVRVEAEEREGDRHSPEGREDRQVEHDAGEHRCTQRRDRAPVERLPVQAIAAADRKRRDDRQQAQRAQGGAPQGERERGQAGVVRAPGCRAKRAEETGGDGDGERAAEPPTREGHGRRVAAADPVRCSAAILRPSSARPAAGGGRSG